MKILHVITQLSISGGAEALLFRLICTAIDDEHVVVSLREHDDYGTMLRDRGVKVIALHMPRGRLRASGMLKLWQVVRREKPDVIQTWMYHSDFVGGIVGKFARHKAIVWGLHNTTVDSTGTSFATRLIIRLCAALSRWVPNAIISCSTAGVAVHQALGYDEKRIIVCHNGYDVSMFSPLGQGKEWRDQQGLPTDQPLIGMVARWDPQKDHANLVEALSMCSSKPWHCILCGVGADADNVELTTLISNHNLESRVTPLGVRSDIPQLMDALQIHILSSRFGEAFPNVLNEAMASGTPCITTDVGDSAYIVGETGWTVPPAQPAALAEAIDEALTAMESVKWHDRTEACRVRVAENFSIDAMVQAYRSVWTRVALRKEKLT